MSESIRTAELEIGDILACYGTDLVSRIISAATCSPCQRPFYGPSHLATITRFQDRHVWSESTSLGRLPCQYRGIIVAGVQIHDPGERIAEYLQHGGYVEIYRLTKYWKFSPLEAAAFSQIFTEQFLSVPHLYDYSGAVLSGSRCYQLSKCFPAANLESLFCSELVAALLQRLQRLPLSNPTRWNPSRLLRQLIADGIYSRHTTAR